MSHTLNSQIHPAITTKKSRKLRFNEYMYIGDNNPERVIRQRTIGSVSGDRVQFRAQPSVPNLLLSAKAWIKWSFRITKRKDDGVPGSPVNFEQTTSLAPPSNGDVILMKPFFSMANSTKSVRLSINGKGITYNEPRYWQKYIGQLWCPEADINKYFSTAGGVFPSSNGAYATIGPFVDADNGSDGDVNFDISADRTFLEYGDAVATFADARINLFEPLYVGCFNWGYDIKERLSPKYWGTKMSNLIPYVRDIDYLVTLDNIAANTLYYHYGQTNGPGFEELTLSADDVRAELVLQWVKPKDMSIAYEAPYPNIHGIGTTQLDLVNAMEIPDQVKLQSWYVDHREYNMDDGDTINDNTSASLNIPVINLYQVPSYILMFATRDKDSPEYLCQAVSISDNALGNDDLSLDINSLETNLELTSIEININADQRVINDRFSSKELYNILLKNSKKDFPYDFTKFCGGQQRRASYPGHFCVLFTL